MTKYTRSDLDKEARLIAKEVRKETKRPARVDHWELILNGNHTTLTVIVNTYDGQRQHNIAI